ncbi:MAG TPA: molecular chaperone DnaK, partial [Chloroflexia bacterium]|nr:molecular chaperone DnaK [Chloroflexia bacterium]
QRNATKDAGRIAGLEVLRIINEPTAGALAYGIDKKGAEEELAVYDLGGGTYDISVLRMAEGVFEVASTNGDTHLGGDDFDQRIIDWLADEFRKEQGIDLRQDRMALQRLKEAAERAKIELSTTQSSEVNLPFITADANGPKHLNITLTRSKLEQLTGDLIQKTIPPMKRALEDAQLKPNQIDEIVMVGGQTRMPKVQEEVKSFFGKDTHRGINPDEVVAVGAAIQAGVLQGEVKGILLVDVTPLTLSVETLGGVSTPMITRNTAIPTKKSETYSTASDNQPSVEIHVLQGERPMASENKSLGRFILDGIPPAPRNVPQVEVTFDIDANGILNVTARDKASGKEQRITITASSGLSKDEVDRMVKEAEAHAEEDKQRRELIELRNQADTLSYSTEKTLQEHGEKIPAAVKTDVEQKLAALREVKDGDSAERIKQAVQDLARAAQKIGEHLYAGQSGGDGQPGAGAGPGAPAGDHAAPSEEGTVEGEFREV